MLSSKGALANSGVTTVSVFLQLLKGLQRPGFDVDFWALAVLLERNSRQPYPSILLDIAKTIVKWGEVQGAFYGAATRQVAVAMNAVLDMDPRGLGNDTYTPPALNLCMRFLANCVTSGGPGSIQPDDCDFVKVHMRKALFLLERYLSATTKSPVFGQGYSPSPFPAMELRPALVRFIREVTPKLRVIYDHAPELVTRTLVAELRRVVKEHSLDEHEAVDGLRYLELMLLGECNHSFSWWSNGTLIFGWMLFV
ncbi:hypothetical protein FKP32DRAFT_1601582 [Trametes sanguinea]|nr:hypothetical protein FKP32DRAFT_1601582 [Trametes sanguinea]